MHPSGNQSLLTTTEPITLSSLNVTPEQLANILASQQPTKELLSALQTVLDGVRAKARADLRYGFSDDYGLFIRKMYLLSSQMYGARVQNYFSEKFEFDKVPASQDLGDLQNRRTRKFFEFKFSFTAPGKRAMSLVQIRLHQKLDGYLILTSDSSKQFATHSFLLSKEQMEAECKLLNASSAHGTKEANKSNATIELRMDVPVDGADFSRWVRDYEDEAVVQVLRAEL